MITVKAALIFLGSFNEESIIYHPRSSAELQLRADNQPAVKNMNYVTAEKKALQSYLWVTPFNKTSLILNSTTVIIFKFWTIWY